MTEEFLSLLAAAIAEKGSLFKGLKVMTSEKYKALLENGGVDPDTMYLVWDEGKEEFSTLFNLENGEGENSIIQKNNYILEDGDNPKNGTWQNQATGADSIALGIGSLASGKRAVAIGNQCISGGNTSFVIGQTNTAYGSATVVYGIDNIGDENSDYSFIGGTSNTVEYHSSKDIVLGLGNTVKGIQNSVILGNNNRLQSSAPLSTDGITYGNLVLGDSNECWYMSYVVVLGKNNVVWGYQNNVIGYKNRTSNGSYNTLIGFENTTYDLSEYAYTFGYQNNVKSNTVALGFNNDVTNKGFALGRGNTVGGNLAVAVGTGHTSNGYSSTAIGYKNNAADAYSTVMGLMNESSGEASTVTGQYNKKITNALFIVGNGTGTSNSQRSNAFEVLEDGRAKVYGAPIENEDIIRKKELDDAVALIMDDEGASAAIDSFRELQELFGSDTTGASGLISQVNENTEKINNFNLINGDGVDSIVQKYSGEVDDTHYGNTNTGESAVVFGEANSNTKNRTLMSGKMNRSESSNSIIGGLGNGRGGLAGDGTPTLEPIQGDNLNVSGINNQNIGEVSDNIVLSGNQNINIDSESVIESGFFNNNTRSNKVVISGNQNTNTNSHNSQIGGSQNINTNAKNTVMNGEHNTNIGENSIIGGYANTNNQPRSIEVGFNNTNNSSDSIVGGYGSFNSTQGGITGGIGTRNFTIHGIVAGQYNKDKGANGDDLLMALGNGTSSNNRSNAFEVLEDGRAKVYGAPIENEDIVRLKELSPVKTVVEKIQTETWTFTLEDGSTVEKKVAVMG